MLHIKVELSINHPSLPPELKKNLSVHSSSGKFTFFDKVAIRMGSERMWIWASINFIIIVYEWNYLSGYMDSVKTKSIIELKKGEFVNITVVDNKSEKSP